MRQQPYRAISRWMAFSLTLGFIIVAVAAVIGTVLLRSDGHTLDAASTAGPADANAGPCAPVKPGYPEACPASSPGFVAAPKGVPFSSIPAPEPVTQPAGIVTAAPLPPTVHDITVQNAWWGQVGNRDVEVFAGALSANASQPVLLEAIQDPQVGTLAVRRFLAPTAVGPIRIVSANGSVLKLQAVTSSALLTFDLATSAYG